MVGFGQIIRWWPALWVDVQRLGNPGSASGDETILLDLLGYRDLFEFSLSNTNLTFRILHKIDIKGFQKVSAKSEVTFNGN